MAKSEEVASRQRELNAWTKRYLRNIAPLRVDGVWGHATARRTMSVKWFLGYGKRDAGWNSAFVRKLRHPHDPRYSPPWQLALGANRRRAQRAHAARSDSTTGSGIGRYDGRPVAAWMIPHLEFARRHGWSGVLVSGWRDPRYSEQLCYAMCGAPRCPGRCAGSSSNHSGSVAPRGAIDVSDYYTFGRLMARDDAPTPRIFNALGAQDPVHFSAQGN